MLDTNEILELERKWERYNKTKYIRADEYRNFFKKIDKKFVILLVLFVLVATAFGVYKLNEPTPKDEINALKNRIKEAQKKYEQEPTYVQNQEDESERNDSDTPQGWLYFNEISAQKSKLEESSGKTGREEPTDFADLQEDQEEQNKTDTVQNDTKAKFQISDVDLSVADLEKKFSVTKDVHIATLIARKYFEKKKYKKSELWALTANELDELNEESWIIFARSKYRQNKKEDAIKILQTYNQNVNSPTVNKWIEKMQE